MLGRATRARLGEVERDGEAVVDLRAEEEVRELESDRRPRGEIVRQSDYRLAAKDVTRGRTRAGCSLLSTRLVYVRAWSDTPSC